MIHVQRLTLRRLRFMDKNVLEGISFGNVNESL